jgi:thiol-disulfide isomerase/thioredoxin
MMGDGSARTFYRGWVMTRLQVAAIFALGLSSLSPRHAAAQSQAVTIEPAAPHWGESVTIAIEPNRGANEAERFDPSDQLYAVLGPYQKGMLLRHQYARTPMTWDGRRFIGHLTLPGGCEAAFAEVATAERSFGTTLHAFVCRTPEGKLPPGALIEGLVWGGRDRSNWQADVAEDMAALRATDDPGWAYWVAWLFRRSRDRDAFTREVFLRDVERVDREETRRTPGLLSSLVYGYDGAGETGKAFDRLKELCDRFPASELTPRLGLYFARVAIVNHREFEPEFNRLLAQVASRVPSNPALRDLLSIVVRTSGAPLAAIRDIATGWIRDDPTSMEPHYLLALALSRASSSPDQQPEAEALVSRAIELSLRPHPYNSSEWPLHQPAFELRSRLRAAHGDLAGAVADARMAQLVAGDKAGAEDMSVEAELWQRLGYGRRAEDLATDAYRLGSLNAEALLKAIHVARNGSGAGFSDYLISRLRERGGSTGSIALRPTPSFSATTLDGAQVDASMLEDRITVLDFWFINCPPCRVERPKLNEIVAEFGDKVRFVGFALDSADALKTYLSANPYKYEVVAHSEDIAKAFGVQGYPTHMVVDRTGKIVWLSGTNDDDRIERLRAMIVRVLASQPAKHE